MSCGEAKEIKKKIKKHIDKRELIGVNCGLTNGLKISKITNRK